MPHPGVLRVQPIGTTDTSVILGDYVPADTVRQVQILTSGKTGLVWLHFLAAILMLLTTISLITPPRWIKGGKGTLANFQRSGILTLCLGFLGWIFLLVAFGTLYGVVTSGRDKFNTIPGIDADWSSSCSMWVSGDERHGGTGRPRPGGARFGCSGTLCFVKFLSHSVLTACP